MRKHPAAGLKAWWKSFRYKIVVIIMAVIFSAAMVINISAIDSFLGRYKYIAKDSFGIIYMSESPLYMFPYSYSNNTQIDNRYIAVNNRSVGEILVFIPKYSDNKGLIYNVVASDYNDYRLSIILDDYSYSIRESSQSAYLYGSSTAYADTLAMVSLNTSEGNNAWHYISNYKVISNHEIQRTWNGTYPSNYLIPLENFTIDTNYDISDAIGSNGITLETLTLAIQTVIENQSETFINIGSEYIQLIPVNTINQLATAENQLRNAENVIQNKSGSLQQSVNSQWNEATTKTRSFVNTITPATAAITNTINSIVSVMPDEVKTLLTVVPLLLFIGWLIGRIGGG